jgi:dihydroorotate dehydrogenase
MIFFALAGKQTFYNRYGFVNKKFDRYVEKLKKRTLRDTNVTNSLVLSLGKPLPAALIKRLIKYNIDRSTIDKPTIDKPNIDRSIMDIPLSEVAQFVLDTCKNKSSEKDISIVKDIIKYFKLKIIIENNFEFILPKIKLK